MSIRETGRLSVQIKEQQNLIRPILDDHQHYCLPILFFLVLSSLARILCAIGLRQFEGTRACRHAGFELQDASAIKLDHFDEARERANCPPPI